MASFLSVQSMIFFIVLIQIHQVVGSFQVGTGDEAESDELTFVVSLRDAKFQHVCGGTLVSSKWVLTLAECVLKFGHEIPDVVVGAKSFNESGTTFKVREVHVHENYTSKSLLYNVALLKTYRMMTRVNYTRVSVAEPSNKTLFDTDVDAHMTSWGKRHNSSTCVLNRLRYTYVRRMDTDTCRNMYPEYYIDYRIFCTTSRRYGFCEGDAGNPLMVDNWVYGILLWVGMRGEEKFDLSTHVAVYRDWITKRTRVQL